MLQHAPHLIAVKKNYPHSIPFDHLSSTKLFMFAKWWYLPLFVHVLHLFGNVLAGNKVGVITWWPLCPLVADC